MPITYTLTKKLLENIVRESFLKFGRISSSSLLDSLKLLGFSYATSAGVSINIEDLKTPNSKKESIKKANNKIEDISVLWKKGEISDTERFQAIIDNWNYATESLKNKIIDYYQKYDPTNNLYIMAFSGARGNMSQVRQLVGMRGLMSDQEGKIIDLPIQSNFREGLSPIDYIISSYGARKGIVDTALKTADSGYLTRKLIYVAQDLVIRQRNCGTKNGIVFLLEKNTFSKNLVGNFLISIKSFQKDFSNAGFFSYQNTFLDQKKIEKLKKRSPLILNLRSSLTCKAMNSICQYCYGWDLAQGKMISLGEAVGIIAAQSIGEPGTQLTMRTFHTGGIFTSELVTQITAPFSGRLIFPNFCQLLPFRTSHGILASKLQHEVDLLLLNWKGKKKEIFLDIGSFIYVSPFSFVKKGQIIAEFLNQTILPGKRKLKPILSPIYGEVRFQNLWIRKIAAEKKTMKLIHKGGLVWISSGKLISVPKESKTNFIDNFSVKKPLFFLFFSSPVSGFVKIYQDKISLVNQEKKVSLNFKLLNPKLTSIGFNFSFSIKNYQYIDAYTLFASIFLFSDYHGKIYLIRTKNSKYNSSFLFITEEDIWKVHCEQKPKDLFWQKMRSIVKEGFFLSPSLKAKYSGIFIKQDGLKMIFQHAFPIFLSEGAVLNSKQGDFVSYKKTIANLINYIQQTEDIVQGLPKIQDLIEARKPKRKSYLSIRPGVFLNSFSILEKPFVFDCCLFKNKIFSSVSKYTEFSEKFKQKKEQKKERKKEQKKKQKKKQIISIAHSIFLKDAPIIFRNQTYKPIKVPEGFYPVKKRGKIYDFKNSRQNNLEIGGKFRSLNWSIHKAFKTQPEFLFYFFQNKLEKYDQLKFNSSIFKNRINQLIVFTEKKGAIFLEPINSVIDYEIPLTSKIIFSPGQFIDIGEPFTEGMIDINELLQILFQYHATLDDLISGSLKGLQKFQLILIHSIQAIYQSQGINISSKHIEIIVRQMTNKVIIKASGDTPFLIGESVRLSLILQISQSLTRSQSKISWKIPKFQPLLLSATHSSLTKAGFLSSAGFQQTRRVLSKAAMEGASDWLRGLKECVIIGRIIPAGSAFLNYKIYLDNLYVFKKKKPVYDSKY